MPRSHAPRGRGIRHPRWCTLGVPGTSPDRRLSAHPHVRRFGDPSRIRTRCADVSESEEVLRIRDAARGEPGRAKSPAHRSLSAMMALRKMLHDDALHPFPTGNDITVGETQDGVPARSELPVVRDVSLAIGRCGVEREAV